MLRYNRGPKMNGEQIASPLHFQSQSTRPTCQWCNTKVDGALTTCWCVTQGDLLPNPPPVVSTRTAGKCDSWGMRASQRQVCVSVNAWVCTRTEDRKSLTKSIVAKSTRAKGVVQRWNQTLRAASKLKVYSKTSLQTYKCFKRMYR